MARGTRMRCRHRARARSGRPPRNVPRKPQQLDLSSTASSVFGFWVKVAPQGRLLDRFRQQLCNQDALAAHVEVVAVDQAEDLVHGSATRQGAEPVGVGRVPGHVPVPVRCAIRPPGLATFAESDLCLLDLPARRLARLEVPRAHRSAFVAASFHQRSGPALPVFRRQRRVRAAPQAPSHDEVPSVRSCRVAVHRRVRIECFTTPNTYRSSPNETQTDW